MAEKTLLTRLAIGALGGALLVGSAGAAVADEVQDDDVDVSVNIAPIEPVGALTLSVAPGGAALTEATSTDETSREFTGTLPTVTVTDDRTDIPANVAWYVSGQSTALTTAGGAQIGAGNLGWSPKLVSAQGDGEVAEGPQVDTILDAGPNNVGLVGEELLALSLDSGEAAAVGQWQANAGLLLKTPTDVTPGAYSGTITLTLWEEAY